MKTAILTSVLALGVVTTALADRGARYEGNSRSSAPRGDFNRGDSHRSDSYRGDSRGRGLPVPPGVPAALVPGNRHSILPAPPVPSFLPAPPIPSISIHAGYSSGYRSYPAPVYHHPVVVPAPYVVAPYYYAPRPVIVAAPVYYPPVYVSSPQVVYVNPEPVVVWNPPVCQPTYYGGSGLSVSFSYYR